MNKHIFYLYIVLLGILLLPAAQAQDQPSSTGSTPAMPTAPDSSLIGRYQVGIMAKAFGDSVVIRWAPNHSALFRQALKSGYLLTRRSSIDKKQQIDYQVVVKPWTTEEWLKNTTRKDTLAAVCSQLVNGRNTPIGANEDVTLDKILDQQNQNDLRMMLALVMADASPRNAMGMALGWVDKKVTKGVKYTYYIVPLTDPKLYPVEITGTMLVNERKETVMKMPPAKTTVGEHTIRLQWNRRLAENSFSAYYLQRSDDGGKTFRRITKRPWIQPPASIMDDMIQYTDSVPQNYRAYHYRIEGITPFGELAPSEIIIAAAVDQTPPPAVTDLEAKHLKCSQVKITWKYATTEPDFAGFVIAKGTSLEGPFTPLANRSLSIETREFIDTSAFPQLPNYYKVVAIDTARNLGLGMPVYCLIKDSEGPPQPTGLQGYIDTTGYVRIVWDGTPDVMGYQVFSANAPDHVFTSDTKGYLAIPAFNDSTTLQTLTRKKYFRVIAYDHSYNPSVPSEVLALTRPDLLRPSTPVIKGYFVSDTGVVVNWNGSTSNDVAHQLVMRRGKNTERWVEIAKIDKSLSSYTDKTIKAKSDYGYALVAVDSSGLRSDISFPLNVTTPKFTPLSVNKLRAFLNPDKSVSLYWDYAIPYSRFVIYKASGKQGLTSHDSVYDGREYRDKRPEKGITTYAIRVILQDGMESALSKIVELDVK